MDIGSYQTVLFWFDKLVHFKNNKRSNIRIKNETVNYSVFVVTVPKKFTITLNEDQPSVLSILWFITGSALMKHLGCTIVLVYTRQ